VHGCLSEGRTTCPPSLLAFCVLALPLSSFALTPPLSPSPHSLPSSSRPGMTASSTPHSAPVASRCPSPASRPTARSRLLPEWCTSAAQVRNAIGGAQLTFFREQKAAPYHARLLFFHPTCLPSSPSHLPAFLPSHPACFPLHLTCLPSSPSHLPAFLPSHIFCFPILPSLPWTIRSDPPQPPRDQCGRRAAGGQDERPARGHPDFQGVRMEEGRGGRF
jgi:hypothetical protein